MQLPRASPTAVALFDAIRPTAAGVSVRLVFGQPAAFVDGNMFLGVFGEDVFLRLAEGDRTRAIEEVDARSFEPMPGRAMREYVVLPPGRLVPDAGGREWVQRALAYASGLAKKRPRPARAVAPGGGASSGSRDRRGRRGSRGDRLRRDV